MRYELNRSAHTVAAYTRDLTQLADWVAGCNGCFDPTALTQTDIRTWLRHLAASGDKPATVRRKTQAVRSLYRFLLKRGRTKSDPTEDIVLAKLPRPLPDTVAERDMEAVLAHPDSTDYGPDDLVIDLLYSTGMRRAELIGLRLKDYDPLRHELKVLGKRDKQRIIPLPEVLCLSIDRYIASTLPPGTPADAPLLVRKNGRPLNNYALSRIVKEKLSATACRKKSPHVLRHSFATAMLNHGADINTVKEFLGHASLAATQIYTHLSFGELKTNYQRAHPRALKNQQIMELQIKAIHFEISDKLTAFTNKKIEKLVRRYEDINTAEVSYTLVKPEAANNKEAGVKLLMPGEDLFASKTADTFEEALDLSLEALEKQLEKRKGKK